MIGKTAAFAFALALATFAGSAALASTGAEGTWLTPDEGAVVEVTACGDALCGHIVTSDKIKADPNQTDTENRDSSLRSRPMKGLALFYGVKGGPTAWTGGSVYDPQDGKTYHGSIALTGEDSLKLTGCAFGPFCKSETWTRIK